MSKKKVPELRFKGFTGDWEQRKLGQLAKVTTGKAFSSRDFDEDGEYLVVTNKNIQDETNGITSHGDRIDISEKDILDSYLLDGNNVLVTMDGVNIGKTGRYSNEKAILAQRVGRLRSEQFEFIYQITKNNNFISEMNKLSVGNAIKHISLKQISDYTFFSPINRAEQLKIGVFLTKLDDTIALHQEKLEKLKQLKKGYLQVMFPQNGERTPRLRFADFSSDWKQRKLKEVIERVRGNDGRMNLPTLTISASSGWLDQRERFSGNIAGNEQKNYTLLAKGELSYNHGNSKLAKYGVVFSLRTHKEALVPRVYHSFKTNDKASSDFIEYMFATKNPDRELGKLVSSGARMDGLLNINYEDFSNINIYIPKIEDQNKIADFLRQFDNNIFLHQTKISALQEIKKVYLHQMLA